MYFDDAPIKKQKEDLLNRCDFSKRLGKSLLEAESQNGYCVGLFGPWGSGKSSIINMVVEEIKLISEAEDKPVIVMSFNPWNFSSADQLLRQYFIMLADRFNTTNDKQLSKIGKEIQKYAGMFNVFGDVGKLIGGGWRRIGEILQRRSISEDNDITKQRDRIVDALQKQKCKVIVVIDDIDRLSNEEIKLVFQLVNSVAKFPNIVYLLSFDREIVARALGEVQNCDGEKYLEKIIQVPIEIPVTSKNYLWKILFDRLDSVLEHHPGMIFEQEYWNRVFYECVSKYVQTIRDVVRIVNGLNMKCDMIGGEVNFADMVAITVIENKIPELYGWVKNNKAKLVGAPEVSWQFIGKSEKDIANIYKEEMKKLNDVRYEEYISILKFFFPYYASKLSANSSYYPNENIRKNLRIGHADIIDRYFALELDSEEVSRRDVNYAIKNLSESEMQNYLLEINSKKQIIAFLNELKAVKDDIPQNRIGTIVKSLFNVGVDFEGESKNSYFGLSATSIALYTIRDIILNLETEIDRYTLLINVIQNTDFKSVQMVSQFINILELSFGRLSANGVENGGEKVISLEQLEACEKNLLKRFEQIGKENNLLEMKYARMVLHLYESFDNEGYLNYMSSSLINDVNKLIFVSFSAERWTSGSAVSWGRNEEYKKLISDEEFEKSFEKCLEDESIWNLKADEQHRIVAMLMWKENSVDWDGHISDKNVERKISELREKSV